VDHQNKVLADIYIFSKFKKLLGCFNPALGQIWTKPAISLHFLITVFNPTYLTQNLVKTTQHF